VRINDGWNADPASSESSPDSLKTRGNRWILRPALTWSASSIPGLQFFFGTAFTPNLSPVREEERLWEQGQYDQALGELRFSQRLRLEQRHIVRTEGLAHRVRYQLKLSLPGAWASWDEVFLNLNTVAGASQSGLDQNRFFVGPQYLLKASDTQVRVEWGYFQAWVARGTARDAQMLHALLVAVDFASI
jgi:hypothetical protein